MKSFLVHIYPREESASDEHDEREIVGVVEGVESEKQNAFTSPEELWEILKGKHLADHFSKKNDDTRK